MEDFDREDSDDIHDNEDDVYENDSDYEANDINEDDDEVDEFYSEIKQTGTVDYNTTHVLTDNCLVKYAIDLYAQVESKNLPFSPTLMRVLHVIHSENSSEWNFTKKLLTNELTLVMFELMLDVPRLLDISYRDNPGRKINLNDDTTIIDYKSKLFIDSAEILEFLVIKNVVSIDEIKKVPFRGSRVKTLDIALENL